MSLELKSLIVFAGLFLLWRAVVLARALVDLVRAAWAEQPDGPERDAAGGDGGTIPVVENPATSASPHILDYAAGLYYTPASILKFIEENQPTKREVYCAWCHAGETAPPGTSHGICAFHAAKLRDELHELERRMAAGKMAR